MAAARDEELSATRAAGGETSGIPPAAPTTDTGPTDGTLAEARPRLAAVVLAAGAGSRFGGGPGAKLLADLAGRPLLQHVLDALHEAQPAQVVVVLGDGAEIIEQRISWHAEWRVRNPDPARGLASSLQVGFAALEAHPTPFHGAFIVLGDQPLLRPAVMHALARAAAAPTTRTIVVPRYEGGEATGARNPVLLLRAAWPLIGGLSGDRGLGPLIAGRPDLVQEVSVQGANPDVDTPADLAGLADPARSSAMPQRGSGRAG